MLNKKETENIIFDCIDQIHSAIVSVQMGIDRGQLVMTIVPHNMNARSDDLSLGKLSVLCDFVISAMQLGYFNEIYEKMQSNENEFCEAIQTLNANLTQSRKETL